MKQKEVNDIDVKEVLNAYLNANGLRKTPERYEILETIYAHSGHLSIEQLSDLMLERKYPVSRATLYNNVQLLLECKLVVRHHFGQFFRFERAVEDRKRGHFICQHCNKIIDFTIPSLDAVLLSQKRRGFAADYSDLCVYGLCATCKKITKQKTTLKK